MYEKSVGRSCRRSTIGEWISGEVRKLVYRKDFLIKKLEPLHADANYAKRVCYRFVPLSGNEFRNYSNQQLWIFYG